MPTSRKKKTILDNPRYGKKPVLLLFEIYVLDVIGHLSDEKRKGIQSLDIKALFNTKASHWKSALKEVLKLSPTVETSMLDNWISAIEKNEGNKTRLRSEDFAKKYADRYFRKNSTLDVWAEGALEKAKKRISDYRKKGLLRSV